MTTQTVSVPAELGVVKMRRPMFYAKDPKRNSAKQCASFRVGATTTILGVKRNVGTSAARNPIRANLPLQNSQNSVTPKERSVAGRFATMPKIAAAMTRSVAPNVETSAAMKTTIISRKTLERTVGTSRLRLLGPRHRQKLSAMALPGSNEQVLFSCVFPLSLMWKTSIPMARLTWKLRRGKHISGSCLTTIGCSVLWTQPSSNDMSWLFCTTLPMAINGRTTISGSANLPNARG
mmetsp:Transcript_16983/g.40287  ORF Transcript_16983/g.40287 Transcript_16983/m.40287 type:complete len:235 (+) Transcript_16983:1872-2576(+)